MALLVYIGYRTVAYIHIQRIRSCRRKLWEHTYMLFKGRPQRYLPTPSPYISERPKRCHRVTTFSFGHREVSSARCTDFWGYRHASLNIIIAVKVYKYFFIAAVIQILIIAMYFVNFCKKEGGYINSTFEKNWTFWQTGKLKSCLWKCKTS